MLRNVHRKVNGEIPNYTDRVPLSDRLIALSHFREQVKNTNRRPRLHRLTSAEKADILSKTGGKCYICGGDIRGQWNADHVIGLSAGGKHSIDNHLPANSTCSHYRWDYLPEEFELILMLGVWARTQIEKGTMVDLTIEDCFSIYETSELVGGRVK
jgi:5-methylcytosine-specific restriction endonuclease McrA